MELPHLGKSCSKAACSKLDFLPYTCDLCSKIFCEEHRVYTSHSCTEQYRVDSKVPVCPKCGEIIPMKPGDNPNIKVNLHIENNCRKEEKLRAYRNKCNKRGCKKKEAIPVSCKTCKLNFCLSHRFEQDHGCNGFTHPLARTRPTAQPRNTTNRSRQEEEDEALARAIQMSLNDSGGPGPSHRQQESSDTCTIH